ncbi:hypothetical protein [Mycobacteroides abscessus]|uniref:hypothetical protein n=1 Tax=Mycobacteroides abscessus TaxID=36809 RepID=UPI00036822B0|nr:hypothetical protein [Mycobacteroides abscessus]
MSVERAISQVIERIPELYSPATRKHMAQIVASVLPAQLMDQDNGYIVLGLPAVQTDEFGTRTARVPLTHQPWADGEVRINQQGTGIVIAHVPPRLPMQDVPALASALMAVWAAHSRR